ncbi:helix-turn-helix transcriptional regulator [Streptomyces acidicola]|uniref:AAA family ATPase n=1 Tax=Streptomyces acidicola TaxID=2596892 RepID=A0A5N8WSG7_9ACTN|nr:AAA family ATPase [Streptomyces acidicola]MPY49766.1 AAA family ATPase [Streptomyces acidicola]
MQQPHGPVIGRDGEVRTVVETLSATGASARVLLVTAGAGTGKTAVVEQARRRAVQEGTRVLRLGWEGAEDTADVILAAGAGRGLAVKNPDSGPLRLTAARRAQLRATERDGAEAPLSGPATIGEALTEAARQSPFALLVDGVERMPRRIAEDVGLLLRMFRPRGVPVVMTGRPGYAADAARSQLTAAADQVLVLPPLQPADIAALVTTHIAGRFGHPAEPGLADAVSRGLGPLEGNPRAVLSVLDSLDEHDLLELDGQLCLTVPERRLRLTTEPAELVRIAWPDAPPDPEIVEAAIVFAHVTDQADIRFEDVLRLQPPADVRAAERKLDRLVADRVLTAADHDGRLSFAVPALGAALRTLPTRRDVRGVYARLVTPVTDRLGAKAAGSGYPWLADQVAAAGRRLDDGLAVPLLLAAAREDARADWPLSVRAYSSALRRLAPQDERTPGVLHEASSLSLRHGDHSGLLAIGEPLLACLDAVDALDAADVPDAENTRKAQNTDGLETVAGAWVLAALHEHRSPYADDADPRYREALERLPAAAGLAAVAGLYGIGPVTSPPESAAHPPESAAHPPGSAAHPAPESVAVDEWADATAPGHRSGPLPSPAELRLVTAAVGSHAELQAARRNLPPDATNEPALDRLRDAAAYGDLAGALAAVLGDRYVTARGAAGDSVATRYRAMVRDYLTGDWDAALAAARHIEVRSRSDGTAGAAQPARALAAEIHCMRGDVVRARAWLERIPDTVTHPLVARARLGARYWSGRTEEALEGAWHDVRQARKAGLLAGVERVLLRILWFAAQENAPQTVRQALEELEALHDEVASPMTHEAVLIGRGTAHRDADSALTAYLLLKRRGDVHLSVYCCQCLTDTADDPRPWLNEAAREMHRLGIGRPFRTELMRAAQRRDIAMPRLRPAREDLNEQDVRLVRMVSDGATNRQIAVGLACSEKTVEQRLTRLFQRTGCRSRAELAAAWLDGNLARLGLLPGDPAGTDTRSGG